MPGAVRLSDERDSHPDEPHPTSPRHLLRFTMPPTPMLPDGALGFGAGGTIPMTWLLVADDDEDLRFVLSEALDEHGYEVRTASDGEEVVRMLDAAETMPALVILDLLMPHVSGREVLQAMRRVARTRRVPVIVLSGAPVEQELSGYGVSAVLLKPVPIQTLVAAIDEARCVRA
jgi:CheY-like chemotaxis protein